MAKATPLLAALAGLALCGCAGIDSGPDPVASTVQACAAENPKYVDAWGCVQGRYATGQISDGDPRLKGLLAMGDDLARKVTAGTLSNADAKSRLAQAVPAEASPSPGATLARLFE